MFKHIEYIWKNKKKLIIVMVTPGEEELFYYTAFKNISFLPSTNVTFQINLRKDF